MQNELLPLDGWVKIQLLEPTYQEQSALVDQLCGVWRLKNKGRFYKP